MTFDVERVGQTPLMELGGVFAKIECVNPGGSVKDRIAHYILTKSLESGVLRPGMRVVEATSGNTGVAVSWYGRRLGFPVTIVMPEHMTDERKDLIRSLGAELILVSKEGSFGEAVQVRDRIAQEKGVFCVDQFANPLNVECHERTTGEEILQALEGRRIDAFVAGVGTGGTLIGVAQALRKHHPKVHIVAVEPAEAAVMTGGPNQAHGIFGIGDGFIPPIAGDGNGGLHPLIDEVLTVSTEEAMLASEGLRVQHNVCCGVSSGANYLAARQLHDRYETVVTIFPDGFSKYVSAGLRRCAKGACPFEELCPEPIPGRSRAHPNGKVSSPGSGNGALR